MPRLKPSQEDEAKQLVYGLSSKQKKFDQLDPNQQFLVRNWLVYNKDQLHETWRSTVPTPDQWEKSTHVKSWLKEYGPKTTSAGLTGALGRGLVKGLTFGFKGGKIGEEADTFAESATEMAADLAGSLPYFLLGAGPAAKSVRLLRALKGGKALHPIAEKAGIEAAVGLGYGGARSVGETVAHEDRLPTPGEVAKNALLTAGMFAGGGALMGRNLPRKLADALRRNPEMLGTLKSAAAATGPDTTRRALKGLKLPEFWDRPNLAKTLEILETTKKLPRALPGFKAPTERFLPNRNALFGTLEQIARDVAPAAAPVAEAVTAQTAQAVAPQGGAVTLLNQIFDVLGKAQIKDPETGAMYSPTRPTIASVYEAERQVPGILEYADRFLKQHGAALGPDDTARLERLIEEGRSVRQSAASVELPPTAKPPATPRTIRIRNREYPVVGEEPGAMYYQVGDRILKALIK